MIGSQIFLRIFFSTIASFLSFSNVVGLVSHAYVMIITFAITLYRLIFHFFDSSFERRHLDSACRHLFPARTRFLIFSWLLFWLLSSVPRYLKLCTFSKMCSPTIISLVWYNCGRCLVVHVLFSFLSKPIVYVLRINSSVASFIPSQVSSKIPSQIKKA